MPNQNECMNKHPILVSYGIHYHEYVLSNLSHRKESQLVGGHLTFVKDFW